MPRVQPFALPIVYPGDELRGVTPAVLERASRRCKSGDATHRGIVVTVEVIARRALALCAPPGAGQPIVAALDLALDWADQRADEGSVRKARSEAFAALPFVEKRTVDAVRASLERFERKQACPIDRHADQVVVRWAGLGAYYATGAALLVLDSVSTPSHALGVGQQAAGAVAYHKSGLGPARSSELRLRAWEQAEWETERPGAPSGHGQGELAVQLFHEFLGSAWKDASDAQRLQFGELVEWAMAGASNGG
jgi:hypothetical protein